MTEALFENRDLGPFDGDALRTLVECATQLQALVEHPGWAYLVEEVLRTVEAEERFLLSGKCASLEEYARRVGRVTGARAILKVPDTLAERAAQARANADLEE